MDEMTDSNDQSADSTAIRPGGSVGVVLGVIALGSLALGFAAARNYDQAERHFAEEMVAFAEAGKELDPVGCADRLLDWIGRCEAAGPLCGISSERLMRACLEAQDRTQYCAEQVPEDAAESTAFGRPECDARVDAFPLKVEHEGMRGFFEGRHVQESRRAYRKTCAGAFNNIARYCDGGGS